MTNGEKFKQIFSITQVDDCDLNVYAWLPNHDAAEISIDWWNAEYKEPTTKNDLGVDCVSRIETIDYLCKHCPDDGECFEDCEEIKHLRQMPSVTPQEPKIGHWIEEDGFDGDVYYDCSECGESWTTIEGTPWDNEWNYCPNCGARMVAPQESEDKE